MAKTLIDFNEEEEEKIKYFQQIFEIKFKPDAVRKIIQLTKITPMTKEEKKTIKDSIMDAFKRGT